MHEHAKIIDRFYTAFATREPNVMIDCYHPEVHFSDPVFPDLGPREVAGMWRMLLGRAKDLKLDHSRVEADDEAGQAHWEARYTFSATGRPVHNVIDAKFKFRDGKIVEHHDEFDFYRWARQALGTAGFVLGWTPLIRNKVRAQARAGLDAYLANND